MGTEPRPTRTRRAPVRLTGVSAPPKRRIGKKKPAAKPLAGKTSPQKDDPMEGVVTAAGDTGEHKDVLPATAVTQDTAADMSAAPIPKIWTNVPRKIVDPKRGVIWPHGKLLSTIHDARRGRGGAARVS